MVVIIVIIVPHSSIPYKPKERFLTILVLLLVIDTADGQNPALPIIRNIP